MPMSRATVATMLLLIITIMGCSTNTAELNQVIDKQLAENAVAHGIPAQTVMVMHNQQVLYQGYHGVIDVDTDQPVDEHTVFPIYSVTKLFTSTLIMQLFEQGKLALSSPAAKYVTGLPEAWQHIRIEQLLSHTSGLPEFYRVENGQIEAPPSIDAALQQIQDIPLLFAADTQIQYNQTNYLLLKKVLESVTGQSYDELVRSQITQPLSLNKTWLSSDNIPKEQRVTAYQSHSGDTYKLNQIHFPTYANAHSGAWSTIDDLTRFLSALAQGKLVSKQLLTKLWQPYQLADGESGYFASGWDYDSSGPWHELGHDGGGVVRVRILFKDNLDDHYIIVYLTNGNKDGVWSRTLVDSIQYYVMPDLMGRMATMF